MHTHKSLPKFTGHYSQVFAAHNVESSPVTTDSLVLAQVLLISCSTCSTKLLFFTKAVVIVVIFDLVSSIARNWTYAWDYIWANTPFTFLPQSSVHKKVGGGGEGEAYFGEFMVLFHRTSLCTAALSFSTQPVEIREGSSSFMENVAEGNVVDKKYCFRMMVWLCAYYDFYDKKVYQSYSQYATIPPLTTLLFAIGDF